MATQTDICRATVATFVEAFGEGRLDDALSLLHDDFVVHAAGDVPYGGDYFGPAGFAELIAKMTESLELTPKPGMQFLADDDKVVLYYELTFAKRGSGKSAEVSMAEIYSVRDGLIAELDVFYKTPSTVAALLTM